MRIRWGSVGYWGGAVAVMAALVLVVKYHPKRPEAVTAVKPIPVRTILVVAEPVREMRRLPGRVVPSREARLATQLPGRIDRLLVREGDAVEADTVLLHIDETGWSNALHRATVEARDADRELQRLTSLSTSGAVSERDQDQARLRAELAQVALVQARFELDRSMVRSPFAGVINARWIEVGEYAREGDPAFHLVVNDPIKVLVDVPERDIAAVRKDDRIPLRVGVLADARFEGRVVFVSPAADAGSHAFRVELVVDNPDNRLRPGMIATVELLRQEMPDARLAPLEAVLPLAGEHVVYVVQENRAVRRRVELGVLLDTRVVIERGLEPGDRLVIEGQRSLEDGVPVDVMDDDPPVERSE